MLVAKFSYTPRIHKGSFTVNFIDNSLGTPTSWLWNFGDGNTATTQNASHAFSVTGKYKVTLTVTNDSGSVSTWHLVYVYAGTKQANAIKNTNISQNVDLYSDDLKMDLADGSLFADKTTDVVVKFGYDGEVVDAGSFIVDEWTMKSTPNSFENSITARDKMRLALDYEYQNIFYLQKPGTAPLNEFREALHYTVVKNNIKASEVAADMLNKVGLKVNWTAYDYNVILEAENEEMVGYYDTIGNILRQLIDNIQFNDMNKIDIKIEKDTVYVYERNYKSPKPITIDLSEVPVLSLTLKRSNKERKLRNCYVYNDNISGVELERVDTVTKDTKDKNGKVVLREVETTYTINGIVTKEQRQQWRTLSGIDELLMVEDTVTVYNYENADKSKRPFKSAFQKLLSKIIDSVFYIYMGLETEDYATLKTKNIDKKIHSEVTYFYDDNLLLIERTYTTTDNYRLSNNIVTTNDEITVRHKQLTRDKYETTTVHYTNGVFISEQVVTQGGKVPNAKKVGATQKPNFWFKKKVVNALTGNFDIKYHNNYLDKNQLSEVLTKISDQWARTKYELSCSMLPMPWLKKGSLIQFSNEIKDGLDWLNQGIDYNNIDLRDFVFYITDCTHDRDINSYKGTLKGVAWKLE